MAKKTTIEQLVVASIEKLKKRKSKIESVLNDRPVSDLVTFQGKVKTELAII